MSYIWHSSVSLLRLLLLLQLTLRYHRTDGEPLSPRSIRTKYGVVRGVLRHFRTSTALVSDQAAWPLPRLPDRFSVEIYRSVPFAQPPVANLRFLPPVTQQRWRGTKLANRFHPVCMQNTAEIASSDLSPTAPPPSSPPPNRDAKGQHHELSPTTLSSVSNSSSQVSSLVSSGVSSGVLSALSFKSANASPSPASVPTLANQSLPRTARTKREGASFFSPKSPSSSGANDGKTAAANKSANSDKSNYSYKLKSSNSTLIDRRPARSTAEEASGQFDRQFIANLLRIHPAYFRPFASYIRNQNEDCLTLNIYVPYDGKSPMISPLAQ